MGLGDKVKNTFSKENISNVENELSEMSHEVKKEMQKEETLHKTDEAIVQDLDDAIKRFNSIEADLNNYMQYYIEYNQANNPSEENKARNHLDKMNRSPKQLYNELQRISSDLKDLVDRLKQRDRVLREERETDDELEKMAEKIEREFVEQAEEGLKGLEEHGFDIQR